MEFLSFDEFITEASAPLPKEQAIAALSYYKNKKYNSGGYPGNIKVDKMLDIPRIKNLSGARRLHKTLMRPEIGVSSLISAATGDNYYIDRSTTSKDLVFVDDNEKEIKLKGKTVGDLAKQFKIKLDATPFDDEIKD